MEEIAYDINSTKHWKVKTIHVTRQRRNRWEWTGLRWQEKHYHFAIWMTQWLVYSW